VSTSSFYNWQELGRAGRQRQEQGLLVEEPIYLDFLDTIEHATARAEVNAVSAIVAAAQRDWRAALALLERRWPERWGKKSFVHVAVTAADVLDSLEDEGMRNMILTNLAQIVAQRKGR